MMSQFNPEAEKNVRCPKCGRFSRVKNWKWFASDAWVMCPKCRYSLPNAKFNTLKDGILAYAQKPLKKPECPCKICELDCNDNIGTKNCALDKGDG